MLFRLKSENLLTALGENLLYFHFTEEEAEVQGGTL